MNPLSLPVRSRIPCWIAAAVIAGAAMDAVSAPIVAPPEAPATDAAEPVSAPSPDLDRVAPAPAVAPAMEGVPKPPDPAASVPAAGIPMEVVGDRVNVRARAGLRYEIVGQVMRGDVVRMLERVDPWCRIDPPPGTTVWIHGEFVRNGEVLGDRVNVRAGPSLSYSVVGTVSRGTSLREVSRYEAWVEIEPTPGASFWVNAQFFRPLSGPVEPPLAGDVGRSDGTTVIETFTPPDAAGVETVTIRGGTDDNVAAVAPEPASTTGGVRLIVPSGDAVDAADPTEAETVASAAGEMPADGSVSPIDPLPVEIGLEPTEPLEPAEPVEPTEPAAVGESLIPPALPETPATAIPLAEIEWTGPARDVVRTGEIHRTGFLIRRPGTHKLVQRSGRRVRLICYLRSDEVRLDEFVGRPVRITGVEQWAKGWPRPVIHVRQANLVP